MPNKIRLPLSFATYCNAAGILIPFAAVLMAPCCLGQSAARAFAEGGNIVIQQAAGSTKITDSGIDSQPDLSFDGARVLFVRKTGSESSEIWVASTTKPYRPQPLVGAPVVINGRQFTSMFSPKFSVEGQEIYFLIPFAATTNAILRMALRDHHKPEFIAAALSFELVRAGNYRGDLVAQVRKAKLAPGYYEWYWLLSPEGKELGVVGQTERDVALFLQEQQ